MVTEVWSLPCFLVSFVLMSTFVSANVCSQLSYGLFPSVLVSWSFLVAFLLGSDAGLTSASHNGTHTSNQGLPPSCPVQNTYLAWHLPTIRTTHARTFSNVIMQHTHPTRTYCAPCFQLTVPCCIPYTLHQPSFYAFCAGTIHSTSTPQMGECFSTPSPT